jgi:hypothetical protein
MGKKGGRNAAKKLRQRKTQAQISETMRAVANARWAAVRAAKAAEVAGVLSVSAVKSRPGAFPVGR